MFETEFGFTEAVLSVKMSQGDCKHRSRKLASVHGFHDIFFSSVKRIFLQKHPEGLPHAGAVLGTEDEERNWADICAWKVIQLQRERHIYPWDDNAVL